MKRIIIFLVFVLCTFISTVGQDIHFSQFYASPLTLNPANSGFFKGNWRVSNIYRNQWSAIGYPFKTVSLSIDKPFIINPKNNILGFGLYIINDNSGAVALKVNKIFTSLAYNIVFDKIHKLSFGLQAGYVVKSFKLDGITFPSQFNDQTGYFDTNLPNYLDTWDQNINYPDFNLGILYSGKFSNYVPSFGIALFHFTNPKESFLRTDNKLPLRVVFHGDVEIPLKQNIFIKPEILTMYHKRAGNWVLGTRAFFIFPEKNMIEKTFAGFHSRYSLNNFDALIFMTGLSLYSFDIGLSYDINISALRQATKSRGAFEISIIYRDITKSLSKIALPCDRY